MGNETSMSKGQTEHRQGMRPNIDIPHALNGRVLDLSNERDETVDETYAEVIRRGVESLEAEELDQE